jgi:SprT-like family protein
MPVSVVHNTNVISFGNQEPNVRSPTAEAYGEFQAAFDFFNLRLFSGSLRRCLITLPHHGPAVGGYFSPARFISNNVPRVTTDEIALNPIHFKGRDATEVLQTLVHEMCHQWQEHFGKPSRRGYHNHQWAERMEHIGLMPSSTGKPGGDKTGQHMGDYVIPDGPFDLAAKELLRNRFRISWYDRLAEYLIRFTQAGGVPSNVDHGDTDRPSSPPGRRQKFSCPDRHVNAWAKPSAKLLCGTCGSALMPR